MHVIDLKFEPIIAKCLFPPPISLWIFVTPIQTLTYTDTQIGSTVKKSTNITNVKRIGNWYTKWLHQLTMKLFHLNAITSLNCICQYIVRSRRCRCRRRRCCCCCYWCYFGFIYFPSMKWKTNETDSIFVCRCQNNNNNNNKSIMAFHQLCKRLFIGI